MFVCTLTYYVCNECHVLMANWLSYAAFLLCYTTLFVPYELKQLMMQWTMYNNKLNNDLARFLWPIFPWTEWSLKKTCCKYNVIPYLYARDAQSMALELIRLFLAHLHGLDNWNTWDVQMFSAQSYQITMTIRPWLTKQALKQLPHIPFCWLSLAIFINGVFHFHIPKAEDVLTPSLALFNLELVQAL